MTSVQAIGLAIGQFENMTPNSKNTKCLMSDAINTHTETHTQTLHAYIPIAEPRWLQLKELTSLH